MIFVFLLLICMKIVLINYEPTNFGVNDIHIAGHARSEGLILVTNHLKEFEHVEALRLDNWVSIMRNKLL